MCIDGNIPLPNHELDDPADIDFGMYATQANPDHTVDDQLTAGRRIQQLIIRSYFTRH